MLKFGKDFLLDIGDRTLNVPTLVPTDSALLPHLKDDERAGAKFLFPVLPRFGADNVMVAHWAVKMQELQQKLQLNLNDKPNQARHDHFAAAQQALLTLWSARDQVFADEAYKAGRTAFLKALVAQLNNHLSPIFRHYPDREKFAIQYVVLEILGLELSDQVNSRGSTTMFGQPRTSVYQNYGITPTQLRTIQMYLTTHLSNFPQSRDEALQQIVEYHDFTVATVRNKSRY